MAAVKSYPVPRFTHFVSQINFARCLTVWEFFQSKSAMLMIIWRFEVSRLHLILPFNDSLCSLSLHDTLPNNPACNGSAIHGSEGVTHLGCHGNRLMLPLSFCNTWHLKVVYSTKWGQTLWHGVLIGFSVPALCCPLVTCYIVQDTSQSQT